MTRRDEVLRALAENRRRQEEAFARQMEERREIRDERAELLRQARALKVTVREASEALGDTRGRVGPEMRDLEKAAHRSLERGLGRLLD